MLMVTFQLSFIEFQGFLFSSLCSVSHVAFTWLFNSKYGPDTSTSDKDLTEETSSFLILQTVDSENLLTINVRQTERGFNLIKSLTEFALVEQHYHV